MTSATLPARRAAAEGIRDMSPIIVGMVPFGLVAGIAAVEAGLPAWGANAFSLIIFAGAAQIAALDLIGQGASPAVVVLTVLIINARMMMYSASLATVFTDEPLRRRMGIAYLVTDQAFAVTVTKLKRDPGYTSRVAYYVGSALALWSGWQVFTAIGVVAGAVIPTDVPITFAIPLCFLALLVPVLVDRATFAAAATSAVVATLGAGLPANSGLLLAAASGITAGVLVGRLTPNRSEDPASAQDGTHR